MCPVSPARVVSVPKFSPIPRLSIVVPVGVDIPAFENTLISVLENKPAECEIIVAHHGNYDDPFSLSDDEVEFVVTDSTRPLNMVVDAAKHARGHIVHVLADGMIATEGWTESALESFEHLDAAIVAPVVRDASSGRIIAAGWADSAARRCQSVAVGRETPTRRDTARVDGAYLQASFWRRDLLCELAETLLTSDTTEAVYAHTLVANQSGWRTVLALGSDVYCADVPQDWTHTSFSRGQRLRAIHDAITADSSGLGSGFAALARNILRPSQYAESFGQSFASLAAKQIRGRLNPESLAATGLTTATTIRIDQGRHHESARRAA